MPCSITCLCLLCYACYVSLKVPSGNCRSQPRKNMQTKFMKKSIVATETVPLTIPILVGYQLVTDGVLARVHEPTKFISRGFFRWRLMSSHGLPVHNQPLRSPSRSPISLLFRPLPTCTLQHVTQASLLHFLYFRRWQALGPAPNHSPLGPDGRNHLHEGHRTFLHCQHWGKRRGQESPISPEDACYWHRKSGKEDRQILFTSLSWGEGRIACSFPT